MTQTDIKIKTWAWSLVTILAISLELLAAAHGATLANKHDRRTPSSGELLISEQLESNAIDVPPPPLAAASHPPTTVTTTSERYNMVAESQGHYSTVEPQSRTRLANNKNKRRPAAEDEGLLVRAQKMIHEPSAIGNNNHPASNQQDGRDRDVLPTAGPSKQLEYVLKLFEQLQVRFVEQLIRQRAVDKDHLLMEKWLVDNINDLHRELKQTEMDFEHYVQVTKNILARSEQELQRRLARPSSSQSLSIGIQATGADYANTKRRFTATDDQHLGQHRHHLERLLLGHMTK
jgi:hypothetical protein